VVECTALEMRHTGNRIGGSNPSLSARFFCWHFHHTFNILWIGPDRLKVQTSGTKGLQTLKMLAGQAV
jgi:hypothetical protein